MAQTFTFRAIDALGSAVRGRVDATNQGAVVAQLRERGLTVLEVKATRGSIIGSELTDALQRVKLRDLAVATRQLATMVTSGLSLLQALYVLEEQAEVPKLKRALGAVRHDVESGKGFADALSAHPKIFSKVYVAMVRAGETGGFLEDSLLRVADQLEADQSLRSQVRSAMVYPAVVTAFALLVMLAMIAFIVPVFAGIFEEQNASLPKLTQVTMSFSDVLRSYPWAIVLGVGVLVYAFRRWKRSPAGRAQWHRLCLRIPFKIGGVVRNVALARWSRTLSSLVSAGVPMLEAIEVTGNTSGNHVIETAMDTVHDRVHSGGTIGGALREEPIFPPMVAQMVNVGETTGALSDTLAKVADFYDAEVAVTLKSLTSILEPLMIVIVGGLVGFIVISMYLPMFDIYQHIQ